MKRQKITHTVLDEICSKCKKIFKTNGRSKLGLCGQCRRERNIQIQRDYAKKNPPKALTKRFNIFKRDNFTCIYCGRCSITDGIKLHVDHLVPKSSEGAEHTENLVTACTDCNLSKANKRMNPEIVKKIRAELIKRRTL